MFSRPRTIIQILVNDDLLIYKVNWAVLIYTLTKPKNNIKVKNTH